MINRRANRLALPFAAQQGDLRVSPVGISQNYREEHPYTLPSRQRDSLLQTKRLRHAACGVVPKASRSREFESLSFQLCRETVERERDSIACTNPFWFFGGTKNASLTPFLLKKRGPRSANLKSRTK